MKSGDITKLMKEAYETAKKRGQLVNTIEEGIERIKEEYNEFIDTLKEDDREHTLEEIADVNICIMSVIYQFKIDNSKDPIDENEQKIKDIFERIEDFADYLDFTTVEIEKAIIKKMAYNKTRED